MEHAVLLVDDAVRFCHSLQPLLQAEHYQVDFAHSGADALDRLQQRSYAAALVDINLPDMAGTEIASHLGTHHPDTAVIILTGNATVDNAVESLRQGVYDYIRKPCAPEGLLRTLEHAIQHKQLQRELRTSEKRFRQLAQATSEGIIIYDRGTLLQTSTKLCRLFAYREEDLIGRQVFSVVLD
ncbi:MAG: response regulator, partial [Desulfobulbaceae bacterium]|nr:response regulator [Desulfobulbaceae bacterium]